MALFSADDPEPKSDLDPQAQAALDAYTVFLDKRPPGPWISPHWTETVSGPVGVPYVVLDALARAVASATVDVKMRRQGVSMADDEDDFGGDGGDGDSDSGSDYGDTGVKRAQSAAGAQEQDEEWESVPSNHPARELFEFPNEQDSIGDILYQHVFQWGMTGSSYEWTPFNSFGEPCRIFSIPTVLTFALPISERYPNGAWRVMPQTSMGAYAVWPSSQSAMGAAIPAEQMVVDRNPHPWVVYDGYSKFQAAATQVDVLKQIDLMRSSAAQNGVEPSLVVVAPPGTSAEDGQRLQDKINAKYSGPYNFRKVLVLTGGVTNGQGLTLMPWSKSPAEVGGTDTWEQMAGFVSALWGVPKVVSGLIEADSYAQLYAALKQFHTFTLIPLAKRIAQRWTQHILWPVWGRNLRVQLDVPAIDDKDSMRADLQLLADNEALEVDELRAKLGFPKWGGEQGHAMVGQAKREHEQEMAATKQQGMNGGGMGGSGNAIENDRPKNPDGKGSLGNRIATARSYSLMNGDVLRSVDASGHEHKGKGPGGGQFGKGGGGGGAENEKSSSRDKPSSSAGAAKEKASGTSASKGPSRAEAVATEREAAREKYEAAKKAYEEARAAMEASGESRREAFEEAKGEAEAAKEKADEKVGDIVDASDQMYWFSGEKNFEAFDRLEEAASNLRDAETFLERKEALRILKKVAAECQRIDVSKIKGNAHMDNPDGETFSPDQQKENQVNLTKIASLIREVGEHMDAQRKHTEDARAIKVIRSAAVGDSDDDVGSVLRADIETSLNGSH